MTKKQSDKTLRQKAEEQLKKNISEPNSLLSDAEMQKLIQELELHKIELQMQNDELMQLRNTSQLAADKYSNLYNFSPTGYITLSNHADIIELNLSAAKMFDKDRSALKNCRFDLFVSESSKQIFHKFMDDVFSKKTKESCEIRLISNSNIQMFVLITGIISDKNNECLLTLVDISERKKSEEELRLSEERYKSLFQNNHSVMLLIDPANGEIMDANPAACKYYGWLHTEICSKNIADINMLSKEEIAFEMQCAKDQKRNYFNFLHRLANGEKREVEVYSGPIQFGNSALLYSLVHDITDRKLAEKALSKSKEKYQTDLQLLNFIFESPINIIIFALDKNYCYTAFTNFHKQTMKNIWGVDIHIGMNMLDVISNPNDNKKSKHNFDRVLNGEHFILTEEYGDIELQRTIYENYYNSVKDADGNIVGISVFVIDVSLRNIALQQLKKSEKRFLEIADHIQTVIWEVDANGLYTYVSSQAKSVWGYDPDELIGKKYFYDLHPQEGREEFKKIAFDTFDQKDIFKNLVNSIINKENNQIWVETNGIPLLDAQNNLMGYLGSDMDITNRKVSEREISDKTTLLTNLIINLQEGILLENSDRKIILTNQLFCSMFGIPAPAESLLGADCSDSAEQSKMLFKKPEKFIADINKILADKTTVLDDELELADGRFFERDYIPTFIEGKYNGHLWKYRDISERKQAEINLANSEERFRQVVEQSREVVWEVNAEGLYTYVSPLAKQVYGYAPEQMICKLHFYDLHPEEQREQFKEAAFDVFQQKGSFYNLVGNIFRPDGTEVIISTNGIPILNKRNELIGYRGIDVDISEQKKNDEKINNQNERLNAIVTAIPDLIFVLDKYGNSIEYYTNTPEKLFVSPEKVIGTNIRSLFDEGTANFHLQNINYCILEKKLLTYEYLVSDGNSYSYYEARLVPFGFEKVLAFVRDITKRKLAEKEISDLNSTLESKILERTSQLAETNFNLQIEIEERNKTAIALEEAWNRLHKIADRVPGALYQYRLSPDGSSCFPFASNGIKDIYRVNPDEIINDASIVFTRIHPNDFDAVVASIQTSANNLSLWRHEYRVRFDDGTEQWLLGNAMPERDADGTVLWHGFISDITERKQAEDELEESREKHRGLSEAAFDSIFFSEKGVCIGQNQMAEKMFGYTNEEALGHYGTDWIVPEDRKMVMDNMLAGYEEPYEVMALRKDGSTFPCMLSGRMMNYMGKTVRVTSLNDITQRKKAETELKEISTRLALATRAGGVGVWDFDIVTNTLIWDDQMFILYGINKEDFDGAYDAWQSGLHPDDRERGDKEIQMAISGEKEFDTEFRVVCPDGTIRFIKALAVVQRDQTGKALRMIGTNWNITLQKRALDFENELLQLSLQLTGIPGSEISKALDMALSRIGSFLSADRAYIFEFNEEDESMTNTYEWCNDGIEPEIQNLTNIPSNILPEWMAALSKYENIVIPSVKDLPDSWQAEREILEPQGIQSLLVIPILNDNKLIGFVGLDSVVKQKEYDPSEITILKVWSNMLAGLLNNQRIETYLDQTRRNYETFFNTIDDFLFVLDEQGNIIHTNNTVTQRLEYSSKELFGRSVLLVHPAERREEAGRIVGEMLAGTADFCPVPLVTKSGARIPVETRVKAGFWNGKSVIFGWTKDVSKIQLSEEKFSKAFQSNAALMAISEFESGKYIDVNDTFLNTLGYSRKEVIGKSSTSLKLFNNSDTRKSLIRQIKQNIAVREVEIESVTKSGDVLIGLFSADPIYIGSDLCLLTVMVDITQRKHAEVEISKARIEAEKANHAKSEFLSRMSHELRTPMNSILGFAQLLEMSDLIPGHKKSVAHILKSGRHLLDLINEVLDIAQIEAGRISLSLEPVKLEGIILETIDIVQNHARDKQLIVKLLNTPSNKLFVKSDNQRFKQVLINLLSNAIKYNRKAGSIIVETKEMDINKDGIVFIRISIIDSGLGIVAEDIPKLFNPFERIGAEKTETEGTGLGLAVVKKLMLAMGGNVGVESKFGVGSTFWIELPLVENFNPTSFLSADLVDHKLTRIKKIGTILHIEDNASNAELVEQILINYRPDINIVCSSDGIQAVQMSLDLKPNLILLDLDLPGIHGTEVLKNLQANNKTKKIPVVIISADAMTQQIERLLSSGVKDYLTKPLDINTFLLMVDEWIGKSAK